MPGGPPGEPDPGASSRLADELLEASCGDVVQVAAGRYLGPFVVPSGVTLEGPGALGDAVVIDAGAPNGQPRTLPLRAFESAAGGCGPATLRDLRLRVVQGTAFLAAAGADLVLERVRIAHDNDLSQMRETQLAVGLWVESADVVLSDVEIEDSIPYGVLQIGGQLDLRGVRIRGTRNCRYLACATSLSPTALVVMGGGVARGEGVTLDDLSSAGLWVIDGAVAEFEDLTVSGAKAPCVSVDSGAELTVSSAELSGCGAAALLATAPAAIRLERVRVREVQPQMVPCGDTCVCKARSGISIALDRTELDLDDVEISVPPGEALGRYGLGLFGAAGAEQGVSLSGVAVEGTSGLSLAVVGGMRRLPEWEIVSDLAEHVGGEGGTGGLPRPLSTLCPLPGVREPELIGPAFSP